MGAHYVISTVSLTACPLLILKCVNYSIQFLDTFKFEVNKSTHTRTHAHAHTHKTYHNMSVGKGAIDTLQLSDNSTSDKLDLGLCLHNRYPSTMLQSIENVDYSHTHTMALIKPVY